VPLGVSLCERDNPGRIKSPSSTQVHGTIVVGVLIGFILLGLLFRFGSVGIGPFPATLAGAATRADGGLDVIVKVTNDGTRAAGASCRISARGAPDFRDYVSRSSRARRPNSPRSCRPRRMLHRSSPATWSFPATSRPDPALLTGRPAPACR